MGLQSKLFRGDRRLEACLTHDSSHITPGSVGDHVTKIQTALTLLGEPHIVAIEITTKTYGPYTAAAVGGSRATTRRAGQSTR